MIRLSVWVCEIVKTSLPVKQLLLLQLVQAFQEHFSESTCQSNSVKSCDISPSGLSLNQVSPSRFLLWLPCRLLRSSTATWITKRLKTWKIWHQLPGYLLGHIKLDKIQTEQIYIHYIKLIIDKSIHYNFGNEMWTDVPPHPSPSPSVNSPGSKMHQPHPDYMPPPVSMVTLDPSGTQYEASHTHTHIHRDIISFF